MILASISMCITGIVEIIRQNYCIPSKVFYRIFLIFNVNFFSDENNSDMNIFFQLPQNICMGLAEIFATVGSLEFAYLAAPRSAQSLFMSLQFCSLGLSSFIGNGYFALYSSTSNMDFAVSMFCLKNCRVILFRFIFSVWIIIHGHFLLIFLFSLSFK